MVEIEEQFLWRVHREGKIFFQINVLLKSLSTISIIGFLLSSYIYIMLTTRLLNINPVRLLHRQCYGLLDHKKMEELKHKLFTDR